MPRRRSPYGGLVPSQSAAYTAPIPDDHRTGANAPRIDQPVSQTGLSSFGQSTYGPPRTDEQVAQGPPKPPKPPGIVGGPGRPPRLPSSQANINSAEENYGITEGDVRSGLYQAALGYGDPQLISQYGSYHPWNLKGQPIAGQTVEVGPAITDNPNSAMATLQRALTANTKNLGETLNRRGTFFSGIHSKEQQELDNEHFRRLTAAHEAFTTAEGQLMTQLARAAAARRRAYGQADAADLTAFLANPPEPQKGAGGGGNGGGSLNGLGPASGLEGLGPSGGYGSGSFYGQGISDDALRGKSGGRVDEQVKQKKKSKYSTGGTYSGG